MKNITNILLVVTMMGTVVSRAQTTSTNAESAARIAIAAAAGVSRELAAATPSNNPASPALSEAFTSPDARQRFLAVEQFARLPEAEQAERLPDFYTQLPTRSLSMWIEGILSSSPHNILDRYQKGDAYDGNTGRWALQLADAAPAMTVEQVADNLKDRMWLDIAARARALWV
ncbi:MAG TPA: hypothetical protein VF430_00785, partial [Verrucomicrobiae bacterium]